MQDLSNHIMDETISPPSNVDPSTASDIRTRPTSNNSGHCSERHTGSHSKNRDKTTPSKPIRKSRRQNMMRNLNGYNGQVKQYMKEYLFKVAMRALCDGRDNNTVVYKKELCGRWKVTRWEVN